MSAKESVRSPLAGRALLPVPADPFEAAIDDVVQLTLGLTSAIAKLAYADGAHARGELERALSRAQVLAEAFPDGSERPASLHQLQEMRAVATRMLAIAPAPSSAAIAAAAAGDETAWNQEAQAWFADRLASGSSPRGPRRRAYRNDTRPDSPRAIRDALPGAGDAIPATALAPNSLPAPTPIKAGTR